MLTTFTMLDIDVLDYVLQNFNLNYIEFDALSSDFVNDLRHL